MPNSLSGATIAFDLDGTLVDTAPDLIGALNVVLGECRLPHLPLQSARHLVGRGARRMIEQGFTEAGEPLDPDHAAGLTTRFIEIYRSRIASESRPFPGLLQALDELEAAGARLCVCTNKLTGLSLELLDALELTPRFAAIVGADKAPAIKPDPRHIFAAVEAAGGDPNRALMVGDSHNDVAAAKAAEVPVVLVSFGYTETPPSELGGDILIDHYAELPAAVERLLNGGGAIYEPGAASS